MSLSEVVIYSFLFLALYFEVFLLIAFFEKGARERRKKQPGNHFPTVSIVVPCFNEETTVGGTIDSLLALSYPKDKLSIIAVDDGSTDGTWKALSTFASNPQVQLLRKENGGKHTALNVGIESSTSEFIGCLDADSFVDTDALREIIPHFENPKVGAVTASMSIYKPKTSLESMQQAEYLFGIALRHVLSVFNALYVTPGPFSIYRKSTLSAIGLFAPAHNTEDMEIALRLQRKGWRIENAPRARVFTKGMRSVPALIKQRTRWSTGFLRNSIDYGDLFGNPKYGVLGMLVLPLGVISMISGIGLFTWSVIEMGRKIWDFGVYAYTVPLTIEFGFPTIEWFFAPTTATTFLGLFALAATVFFIGAGIRVSKTHAYLTPLVLWHLALYSLLAPFWLIRSMFDVLIGARRSWR